MGRRQPDLIWNIVPFSLFDHILWSLLGCQSAIFHVQWALIKMTSKSDICSVQKGKTEVNAPRMLKVLLCGHCNGTSPRGIYLCNNLASVESHARRGFRWKICTNMLL